MHDMGLRSDRTLPEKRGIVGEVLGKYHPHGDAAVYETMARWRRISHARRWWTARATLLD